MQRADPILIVGGGPVGLLLACLLTQRAIPVQVLEKDAAVPPDSRAIGIHPPGLDALAAVGVADELIDQGVRVPRGVVHLRGRQRGVVSFARVHPTYPFVLSVPQRITTCALQQRLHDLAPGALMRERRVTALASEGRRYQLTVEGPEGAQILHTDVVIACDGAHSLVAHAVGLAHGDATPGPAFVMADVPDTTTLGEDAHLFLGDAPVVESFPLPGHKRRWVVGIGRQRAPEDRASQAAMVERLVAQRTSYDARAADAEMVSAFAVEQHIAPRLVRDGIVLAGDAAHVVSPIGGQGMSLGWLDARHLAAVLPDAGGLVHYDRARRSAARRAATRAALFTWLGSPAGTSRLRDLALALLVARGVRTYTAQLIAMRGLA